VTQVIPCKSRHELLTSVVPGRPASAAGYAEPAVCRLVVQTLAATPRHMAPLLTEAQLTVLITHLIRERDALHRINARPPPAEPAR
jgi:hypothetical protein